MSPEKNEKLIRSYPLVFKFERPTIGMDCGDGWYNILDGLCQQITNYLESDEGKHLQDNFSVAQIKEKFGGLRFYVDGGNDKIWALIDQSEQQSIKVCEDCGSPGSRSGGGWIRTLCERCEERRNKRK